MNKIIVADDLYGFMSKQYDADGIVIYEEDEIVAMKLVDYFKKQDFEVSIMKVKENK